MKCENLVKIFRGASFYVYYFVEFKVYYNAKNWACVKTKVTLRRD